MRYRLLFPGKILLVSTLVLLSIGVVMVYSSSMPVAEKQYQDGYYFLKRYLIHLVIGLSLMSGFWVGLRKQETDLRRWVYPALILGFVLLAAVLYSPMGIKIRGSQRWLGWNNFSFQPVELAKFCFLFYMAHILARAQESPQTGDYNFVILGLVLGAFLFLIICQPDIGNTFIVCGVSFILLFLAQVHLIYLACAAFIAFSAGILWLGRIPYIYNRLLAFINPWQHAGQSGFQAVQSYIALGSGGLWGLGLGAGQQKLGHLPEAYTDFILSVIGEEWGLIGTSLVTVLFLAFIWSGLKVASKTQDLFAGYLTAGITCFIGLQALVNIGVVTALLPTKGLPLPFVSYGGTSLIASLMGVGVLLAFASKKQPQRREARVMAKRHPRRK